MYKFPEPKGYFMTKDLEPIDSADMSELKAELIELKNSITAEEQTEDTKLYLEVIDILLEELAKRDGKQAKASFRDDVKFMAYLNLYETLMTEDDDFEDFEFDDEDFEEVEDEDA
jgi:hypothetical protein